MKTFYTLVGLNHRSVRRIAMAALAGLALFGASANTHLIIHFTDGTKTGFVLADRPSVRFVDNKVRVRAQHMDTDFDAARVAKFVFGDEMSATVPVEADETRFTIIDPDHISVCGLKAGESVVAVTVDGRIVMTAFADSQGLLQMDLSPLQRGVLIIATQSGQTLKLKH